jgi:tRNA threonylcarbamoyladenosine biosynthesis protein TsaB
MLFLAMDTSSKAGSVAIFDGGELLESLPIGSQSSLNRPSTSNFSSDVAELLKRTGREIGELRTIAVTVGPGSFTGLRVGVVAAKTLGFALKDCQVIGVNTLMAIAASVIENSDHQSVCTVMDAQRGQLFAAQFEAGEPWAPTMSADVKIIEKTDLDPFADGNPITGPGLSKIKELEGMNATPEDQWNCTAEKVGRVAIPRIASGSFDDQWSLKPIYYRASTAEENRLKQK